MFRGISKIIAILPLIFAISFGSRVLRAGDISGIVKRPPYQTGKEKPIDRYRGRSSRVTPSPETMDAPDPGFYSVIYLTGDSLPAVQPLDYLPKITQKDKMFQPPVMAVTVGSTVEFPNLDPYYHNVFSYSKPKKFDLGRYEQGKSKSVTFDTPGLVKIFCEIHYSMRAYLHVLDTPYYAVTDEHGSFSINDVKAGVYTLHLWQENQDNTTMEIVVTDKPLELTIE